MSKLLGKLVCWWRGHHLNGYKRRSTVAERLQHTVTSYVYQCTRCGHLACASMPVKRAKNEK